jgi:hypothetical protein
MGKPLTKPDESLYERDFYAWLQDQAEKLRARAHNEIDWENLAEEIESVGRSQRRELKSRLALLIHRLLKWQFQPGRRSENWRISIGEQRMTWIPGIIEESPSLKSYPAEIFADAYAEGRRQAIVETGLSARTFPVEPPFTLADALNPKFWPGEPFELYDILRD